MRARHLITFATVLVAVSVQAAGCSNPVVEAVTGVDVVKTYSAEQKAAYRSALTLAMKNLLGDVPVMTDKDWAETFHSAEVVCQGLNDNGREWVRQKLVDSLLQDTAGVSEEQRAKAGVLADVFINSAVAQGSYCPEFG